MFSSCETDFNLDRHVISFLHDTPFFAELSRYIRKVPSKDIPTAGVSYDTRYDDVTLYWNPDFFASLNDEEIRGVLVHEYYHLIFQHISTRLKKPMRMWNIATDLAINSIILDPSMRMGKPYALPTGALVPGRFPVTPEGRAFTKEEKAAMPLAELIESFPTNEASEWYFDRLKEKAEDVQKQQRQKCPVHGNDSQDDKSDHQCQSEDAPNNSNNSATSNNAAKKKSKKKGTEQQPSTADGSDHGDHSPARDQDLDDCTCCSGDAWIDTMDDHSGWEAIPEDLREKVKGQISSMVDKAAKLADSQSNGWGSISAELREEIRKSVSRIVDWRTVLRNFVGSLQRGSKTTSMKRINKRYPYVHPGTKRGYMAKLLVAIDQSGSVSNEMLSLFFGELTSLTKHTSISILPFDTVVVEADLVEWRRGSDPIMQRTRVGGTDFNAPTQFANDPKNRGRWDGMLVLTDGECSAPGPSRIKRGWVLGPSCKLMFESNDITITIDPNPHKSGAWR